MAKNIQSYYELLMKKHGIALGDFPEIEKTRSFLATYQLTEFPELNPRLIDVIDIVLTRDIPKVMETIQV